MSSDPLARHFASDNWAGACPEALAALGEASAGHAPAYGDDAWTAEAERLLQEIFETKCEVFFVFNGTAANALAVAAMCASYECVFCHRWSHLATDECGAPGFFAHGVTLSPLDGANGKISPEAIAASARRTRGVHHPKPRGVSITQATELGTIYSPEEIGALGDAAKKLDLWLHMDGARFANAAAALGLPPRRITWEAGVDVLTLGGAKNGLPFGEALIFFNAKLAGDFGFRRKQGGQLASKMRFLAAPWVGVLRGGAWLRYAARANAMAGALERGLRALPGVRIVYSRDANAVFAALPPRMIDGLRSRGWHFYTDIGPENAVRLMASWDTTAEDVSSFLRDAGC